MDPINIREIHFHYKGWRNHLNRKALSFRHHVNFGDIVVKYNLVIICIASRVVPSQGELFSGIFGNR